MKRERSTVQTAGVVLKLAIDLAAASLVFAACAPKAEQRQMRKSPAVASDNGLPACGTESALQECYPSTGETETFSGSGIPSFCNYSLKSDGKGQLACTPRELELNESFEIGANFDLTKSCSYTFDKITCKIEGKPAFEFSLAIRKFEEIYAIVDSVALTGRLVINLQVKNLKEEEKAAINDVFAAIVKHKKAIFTGGSLDALITELVAAAKKVKPDLTEAQVTELTAKMKLAFEAFDAKRKAGTLTEADLFVLAQAIPAALPASLSGQLTAALASINLQSIMNILSPTASNAPEVVALITALGGAEGLTPETLIYILSSLQQSIAQ